MISAQNLRKRIGYVLVAIIAIYFVVSIWLTINPKATFINRKITGYYKWFVLPGPFFRDDKIRYVPVFVFSHKEVNGSWCGMRNVEKENFTKYHEKWFDYPDLKRSRYERFLARSMWRRMQSKPGADPTKFRELHELHLYLKKNYLPENTDSVKLEYKWKDVQRDTTDLEGFSLTYKSF